MSLVYHSSRLCFCRSWILLSWNSLPIGGTEGALQRQTHDPARESWESSNYTSVSIYFLNKKLVFYFLPSLVLKGLKHDPRRTKWIENILVNVSGQEPSLYFNLRLQFMSVFFFFTFVYSDMVFMTSAWGNMEMQTCGNISRTSLITYLLQHL